MSIVTFRPNILNSGQYEATLSSSQVSIENNRYNDFINIKNRVPIRGYAELQEFVRNNILYILSSAVDKKPKSLQMITDKDFLIAMDMNNDELPKDYVNRFNRVCRAYLFNPSKNVIYNKESAGLLYKIAYKLNKKMVDILKSVGLNEEDATWLIINRYSSTDERRNIRRMVRAMQHMPESIMTEQMVVDIFSKTFYDQLTNLFCAVMTDRFDYFDNKNEEYVYSTVSNALLDILNTMDFDDIKSVLIDYIVELNRSEVSGRFSLNSINPSDYRMIVDALENIEVEDGIKIP